MKYAFVVLHEEIAHPAVEVSVCVINYVIPYPNVIGRSRTRPQYEADIMFVYFPNRIGCEARFISFSIRSQIKQGVCILP